MVKRRTGWGSVRGSLNFSMQIQVENERPGCGGKARSPIPMPPITLLSCEANELTPKTTKISDFVYKMPKKKAKVTPSGWSEFVNKVLFIIIF